MPAKNRFTVNLDPESHVELQALSERYGVSLAWLGRQAVRDFLDRYREQELQLPLSSTTTRGMSK